MTTLVAVAFPYETTASAAAEDVRRTALDIVVDAGAVAVVSCDRTGRYHATTNHAGTDGTRWGVFWILLFTALFFAPSPAPHPDGHRQLHRRWDEPGPFDDLFRQHMRDMLTPGTSGLFLAVEHVVSEEAVRELTRFGGVLVTWGLPADADLLVQGALHGVTASGAPARWWHRDAAESRHGALRSQGDAAHYHSSACGAV